MEMFYISMYAEQSEYFPAGAGDPLSEEEFVIWLKCWNEHLEEMEEIDSYLDEIDALVEEGSGF